jgi:hypothetical protein
MRRMSFTSSLSSGPMQGATCARRISKTFNCIQASGCHRPKQGVKLRSGNLQMYGAVRLLS